MKYKVGDKVRVKENLIVGKTYGGLYLHDGAGRHIGEKTIVTKVEKDRYRLCVDNSSRIWTYEMLEPVEEMSVEEAIRLQGEICMSLMCRECPIDKLREDSHLECAEFRAKHSEEIVKILKQWKADHEKKPIETEYVWYAQIIEADTHLVKHEELLETDFNIPMDKKKEEVLKKYCSEHEGKYYAIGERRCVVKE